MPSNLPKTVSALKLASSALGLVLVCQSGVAIAQGTTPQQAAEASDDSGDQILVIGKREQNLREVAGVVNVVSSADLEKIGAKDAEDIFKLTPGVQFSKSSSDGAMLSIRGIGTNTSSDNTSIGQLPTGIYIEDVPFTDPYQYVSSPDISAFDLDSVKVMRGPQGALYGSGSLGGAVNYTFRKPELSDIGAAAMGTVDVADGGGTGVSGYASVNVPLVNDMLAFRAVGQIQNDPGYIDNIGTKEKDANSRQVKGGRAMLLFKPDTNLTIDALYMYQESYQRDTSASVGPNVYFYDSPRPSTYASNFSFAKVGIDYILGPVKLSSLTSYQRKERNINGDLTRFVVPDSTVGIDVPAEDALGIGPFPNVKESRNIEARRSDGWTQEFRIASAEKGTFNWLLGVFGQDSNFFRRQDVFLTGANDPTFGDLYYNVSRNGTTKERAVFGEAQINLGRLEIGAGGRYFHTSVTFNQVRIASLLGSAGTASNSHSESGFTPKFQVRYRMPGETVLYAQASKGFRFGGVNVGTAGASYKSDSLWSYEGGVRFRPAAGLDVDLGAFYIDWKDPQINSADQNGFLLVTNVAGAESKGAEMAVNWRPADGLRFSGSVTYTDAKTTAPLNSTRNFATDVAGGFSGNFVVPAGTRLPGTPKWQASFQPEYRFPGPAGTDMSLSGVVAYTGERLAQIDADVILPAFTTVDMRLKVIKDQFEVALGVSNLFNEKGQSQAAYTYFSTGTGTDGYADYYLIRPRIYSLSVKVGF